MRNVPAFIAMVWRTSRLLTATSLALRLVRALVPVATLYVGKLIIDEIVQLVQQPDHPASPGAWLSSGRVTSLILLLLAEFALAMLAACLWFDSSRLATAAFRDTRPSMPAAT